MGRPITQTGRGPTSCQHLHVALPSCTSAFSSLLHAPLATTCLPASRVHACLHADGEVLRHAGLRILPHMHHRLARHRRGGQQQQEGASVPSSSELPPHSLQACAEAPRPVWPCQLTQRAAGRRTLWCWARVGAQACLSGGARTFHHARTH